MTSVVVILGGLLVGYEPVGGDPDRLYRPLKTELAQALQEGRLPFWSDHFGLGVPLVAESQVAAFYPPNLVLYRLLDVNAAYRWAMLLHYLVLAGVTYLYGRKLSLTPWGSALAALAFTFCGFQAIHSSHEPFYEAIPYLPLALLLTESYVASARAGWLALLALTLGAQLFLGHFQLQMWTEGLVILTGIWRVLSDRRPWSRALAVVGAVVAGVAIAAVQLALTWDLAREVGQTERPVADLAFYSFPPAHWIELAFPRFFQGLVAGPEDPYWIGQQTTGYEAALYIGTVPLIFAFAGLLDLKRGKLLAPWQLIVPVSIVLATMPRWWPGGYASLLQIPGIGYFRCPARYTLLTSLGLALLAGQGFDRALTSRLFRTALILAIAFLAGAAAWGFAWSARSDFQSVPGVMGLPFGVAPALVVWTLSLLAIVVWRRGEVGSWVPFLLTAVELGVLYHASTTKWDWAVSLPADSPVLKELLAEREVGRIGGVLDDIPVRAGLATASPYLGFNLPAPHPLLQRVLKRWKEQPDDPFLKRWLRRYGVTHLVLDNSVRPSPSEALTARSDGALDRMAYRPSGIPENRSWRIIRLPDAFPAARVATQSRLAADRAELIEVLSRTDLQNEAIYLPQDTPGELGPSAARNSRVVRWDGRSGIVEHDGPCDLVVTRAYDPGWHAVTGDGQETTVRRVEGGLQAVRLPGSGRTSISFWYSPPLLRPARNVSLAAVAAVLGLLLVDVGRTASFARGRRPAAEPAPVNELSVT